MSIIHQIFDGIDMSNAVSEECTYSYSSQDMQVLGDTLCNCLSNALTLASNLS